MKKKLTALCLTAAMLFTLPGISAFAGETAAPFDAAATESESLAGQNLRGRQEGDRPFDVYVNNEGEKAENRYELHEWWDNINLVIEEKEGFEDLGHYTYQWEKTTDFDRYGNIKEDAEWKSVGTNGNSLLQKVLVGENDGEAYRCTVTGTFTVDGETTSYTDQVFYYYWLYDPNIYFGIESDKTYYDFGDAVTLAVEIVSIDDDILPEGNGDNGYRLRSTDLSDYSFQWQRMIGKNGVDVYEDIEGATGSSYETIVDGESYRCLVTIPMVKQGAYKEAAGSTSYYKLDAKSPFYAYLVDEAGKSVMVYREMGFGEDLTFKAVLGNMSPSDATDVTSVSYQWQSCEASDAGAKAYKDIPGATTDTFQTKLTKYQDIQCIIRLKYKYKGENMTATVTSYYAATTVRNVRSLDIVVRDENGKGITKDTKGKVTLTGAIYAEDPADAVIEWVFGDGQEKKSVKGPVLTVDMPTEDTGYSLCFTDKYGTQIKRTIYLPYGCDPSAEEQIREVKEKLSVGKNKVMQRGYIFSPEKTGLYRIYSSEDAVPVGPGIGMEGEFADPLVDIYNASGMRIASGYDLFDFLSPGGDNYDIIVFLEAEQTYYFDCLYWPQQSKSYFLNIEEPAPHVHIYDAVCVTREATEDTDGEKSCSCLLCGETKTEVIPKTGKKTDPSQGKDKKPAHVGELIVTDDKLCYVVTCDNPSNLQVQLKGSKNKKVKKITVPERIVYQDFTYRVSSVAAKAFSKSKKLKGLTFMSLKLTAKSFSKKSFKGLSAKTVIYVPKKKLAKYRKIFRKCGLKKLVKIKAIPVKKKKK